MAQVLLGVVQIVITDLQTESCANKYLRVLTQVISTSIALFATIKQSLDHSRETNHPEAKTQHQKYCFMLMGMFFLQYKQVWFDNYSKAFAGDRME